MIRRCSFASIITLCLICITLILIQVPASLGANSTEYTNCSATIQCGTLQNISYPFWGVGRADYCGRSSGFQLACVDNTSLQINVSGLSYRVLRVDYSSRLFTVARADYNTTLCPNYLYNSSQDPAPFSYSSDTLTSNLTLYYGCATPSATISPYLSELPTSQFTCSVNRTNLTGYFLTTSVNDISIPFSGITIGDIATYFGECSTSVVLPANRSAVQTIEDSTTTDSRTRALEAALEGGFGLQWADDDEECQSCIRSGGQCGRNQESSGFECYCSDKSSSSTCGGNKDQVGLGIGLALAGAGLTGLLLGFWIFSLRSKKRRKREAAAAAAAATAASSAQSQSKGISGPPSSKSLLPISTTSYSRTTTPSYPSSKSDLEKGSTYFGVQVFSYMELEEATHNFDPARELGDGGFGTVYYGELHDGRVVAVKRLYENNVKRVEQFMNEVEILTRLRHSNLVTLYGCTSRRSRELLLVYEFIPNGTVADHLHGKRAGSGLLPWRIRLNIAIETADALAYLHESDVIHRDVKTNNILLDNKFCVKVADFGPSRLFPNDVTHVSTAPQGTPGYVDPEYYQCYQLTDKSDVYSFGVVLCELLSSKPAVDTNRLRHDINLANMAINKIQNHTLHELVDPCLGFETDYSVRRMATLVAELAFRCLQQERDMRPSMLEVLEALRRIKNEENSFQSSEVAEMDIRSGDAGLPKNTVVPPPFSPESVVTDKCVSNSDTPSSF